VSFALFVVAMLSIVITCNPVSSWISRCTDLIGLIQRQRPQERSWEHTARGSIIFPIALADRVIRTIQAQVAKSKDEVKDDD